ncbi:MAG: M15 family metallopeptidase [Pseudomonadota bacterium]
MMWLILLPLTGILGSSEGILPATCTYADWTWNSRERRPVDVREVEKPYSALTDDERDAVTGCSLCREDQVEIALPGLEPFQVCKVVADDLETALRRTIEAGFQVETVTGYRVGRSKGVLDAQGRRTEYSNHSFGLAIDVNADRNGLYDRCTEFSGACRLIRGGEWRPGEPGGITPETPLYEEMTAIGWKWGGELPGRQKDFMHFSPSGD